MLRFTVGAAISRPLCAVEDEGRRAVANLEGIATALKGLAMTVIINYQLSIINSPHPALRATFPPGGRLFGRFVNRPS